VLFILQRNVPGFEVGVGKLTQGFFKLGLLQVLQSPQRAALAFLFNSDVNGLGAVSVSMPPIYFVTRLTKLINLRPDLRFSHNISGQLSKVSLSSLKLPGRHSRHLRQRLTIASS
jgi:hypothetical protein